METEYSAVTKYSSFVYEPSLAAHANTAAVIRVINYQSGILSPYKKMRIRQLNIVFMRNVLPVLKGINYIRALETMKNLRA